jgi:hypothetical protein
MYRGLRAEISGDRLLMKHGDIGCTRNKGTVDAEDITCSKNAETNQVVCDRFAHKDPQSNSTGEQYRRVSEAYCN